MTMFIRTLGPLEVELDGRPLALGGQKQSLVLALLVLHANRVVPVSTIIDAVWGEEPNDGASRTLQVYVSNLRKLLEPHGRSRGREVITTQRPGYVIGLDEHELDALAFDALLVRARDARADHDLPESIVHLRAALALWRGAAFADHADNDKVRGTALRLDNQRMAVLEECLELELEVGGHGRVLGELQGAVEQHPVNERLRGLLMLALYRAGRQADALAVYKAGREHLLDELGIDPGPELRALELRILAQDPGLELGVGPAPAPGDATVVRSHVGIPGAELRAGDRLHVIVRPITTIGRRADRDLVIDDADVSRSHAEIRWLDGTFVLADCGSTNGTFVDGRRIQEHVLEDGSTFTIGSTEIAFRTR